MICRCYDNKMHGVAWAQVHSISFPADRDVNFNCMDNFKFWTDFEKEIKFWKCSFKILNAMLIANFINDTGNAFAKRQLFTPYILNIHLYLLQYVSFQS